MAMINCLEIRYFDSNMPAGTIYILRMPVDIVSFNPFALTLRAHKDV